MKRRIYKSMCALSAVAILVTATLLITVFTQIIHKQMRQEIRQEAIYLSGALNHSEHREDYLATLLRAGATRVTLIAPDGTVLFDTLGDPAAMQNHLDRPEVRRAFSDGVAQEERLSDTFGSRTYYCAMRLQSGEVLRLARATDSVFTALAGAATVLLLVAGGAFFLALLVAERMTLRIIAPLNALDLEHPEQQDGYPELSPLLVRISHQNAQIERQMNELRARQEEFSTVTDNMAEGLVLLDADSRILTVNRSALRLLDAAPTDNIIGRGFLVLSRRSELQQALLAAQQGKQSSVLCRGENRDLQLYASPVMENGNPRGILLLILDVTERERAEQVRREFSANVSHELKTPLTSISGFAEMMMNDMVKPADFPAFARRIYQESGRLIALIEDTIKISKLDEHTVSAQKSPVDLLALAQDIRSRLEPTAAPEGISIAIEGDAVTVSAVPQMMDELLYNLCENAIKYNKPNGSVKIALSDNGSRACLTVSDTGIGIPKEHQSRVFERFYRVDPSHSRQTGGTGLGLSIVKHIVEYHNGSLTLDSTWGEGTQIRVELPHSPTP